MSAEDAEAELARLRQENAELRAALEQTQRELQELKQREKLRSRNSHKPPSSDPPWEERPSKPKSKRKPKSKGGGGRQRERVEPTRVHPLYPTHCRRCGAR